MFKLGAPAKDKASGLKGSLLHMQIVGKNRWYNFQPAGLNPETETPVPAEWITEDRIECDTEPDPDLPLEAMGTQAKDKVTGFKGTITAIIVHLNGCIHLQIQPAGKVAKTGAMIDHRDFDIRMLEGPALKNWSEQERKASQRTVPSPAPYGRVGPRRM